MDDLLALSARIVDEGVYEGPQSINRITSKLSEIGEGIAMVEAFSHVVAFNTGDGLVLFDTSLDAFGEGVCKALRGWSKEPVDTIAYTHGHLDHVGGAQAFLDDATQRGARRPRIVGHTHVIPRFDRYRMTLGYNGAINDRQFANVGGLERAGNVVLSGSVEGGENVRSMQRGAWGPRVWVEPDTTFDERMSLKVGNEIFELRHAKGETDDHLWAWVPGKKAICAGDFLVWVFPNAGNPQKVQRYPLEWARALREMEALEPELLLPAHGLPIGGKKRIATVLDDIATALEIVVEQCLELMNDGARLDRLIHEVRVPKELMEKPYLRPIYDEPEFVVHNVWRLYGGWYDGNPANLKPAPEAALAGELARLAGGAKALASRAAELSQGGEHRLACHLVEMAALVAPEDKSVHGLRAEVYEARRKVELSQMARGIYGHAARSSAAKAGMPVPGMKPRA